MQIGYRITDGWDDTVNAGIAKVEKYISSLAKDTETAALVDMVFNLLKMYLKQNQQMLLPHLTSISLCSTPVRPE